MHQYTKANSLYVKTYLAINLILMFLQNKLQQSDLAPRRVMKKVI